jgi:hypothetical protein
MSEPSLDIENQADQKQSEPKSSDSDPRTTNLKFVTNVINSKGEDESPRSSRLLPADGVPVADSTREEEGQQNRPHLGVQLSGYRLLNIVVWAFCIRKAHVALTHCGQTVVPATPELVAGIFMAVV